MSGTPTTIRLVRRIAEIGEAAWDACAGTDNPFVSYAFLSAMEDSGAVAEETGWGPLHLVAERGGEIVGVAPAYLKGHSYGEYVFDHGWADAFERAGGQYYPKLQIAVPFTPVPGPRFLARGGDLAVERLLAEGAIATADKLGLSSVHVTFLERAAAERLAGARFLLRTDQQFHWENAGYGSFDDFLAALASRKRKQIRKERETAQSAGLTIRWLTGADIEERHWDAMYRFYMATGARKWGTPYLDRRSFALLGERMADKILLVFAERDGTPIAGALNVIGADTLYGRYWGCTEEVSCLHFEICYYQAIDYALARGLKRVEAGAQGSHKLARGYLPTRTQSLHWIAHAGLKAAVANFLEHERAEVEHAIAALADFGPFRRSGSSDHDLLPAAPIDEQW